MEILVPMFRLVAMKIRPQSILIVVIAMALSPCSSASTEASYSQLAQIETRRDITPCLELDDAIPCIVDEGFECLKSGDTGSIGYACRREHPKGFAVVVLYFLDSGWVSYFKWNPKPPSE